MVFFLEEVYGERNFISTKKKERKKIQEKNKLENRFRKKKILKLFSLREIIVQCTYLDASAKIHVPSAKRLRHWGDVER